MALRDLSGLGAVTDALATTNSNLAAVLRELQQTNSRGLAQLNDQISELNRKMDRLVELVEQDERGG